jgi:hypothetical protein
VRHLLVLAVLLFVAVISPHKAMAKADLPVDPRLASYIESQPEELRETLWSMIAEKPEKEREVWIRLTLLDSFLDQESFSVKLNAILLVMAETLDGCLLPAHYCDDAKKIVSDHANYGSAVNAMHLLSGAIEQLNFESDCQTGRQGFVKGFSQQIGESHIVLMTETNDENSSCFVRNLGAS